MVRLGRAISFFCCVRSFYHRGPISRRGFYTQFYFFPQFCRYLPSVVFLTFWRGCFSFYLYILFRSRRAYQGRLYIISRRAVAQIGVFRGVHGVPIFRIPNLAIGRRRPKTKAVLREILDSRFLQRVVIVVFCVRSFYRS